MEEKETFPTRAKDDVHAAVRAKKNKHISFRLPIPTNFRILFSSCSHSPLFPLIHFPHSSTLLSYHHNPIINWNPDMLQGELVHFTNHTELWKLDAVNVTITSGNRSSTFKRVRFVFEWVRGRGRVWVIPVKPYLDTSKNEVISLHGQWELHENDHEQVPAVIQEQLRWLRLE